MNIPYNAYYNFTYYIKYNIMNIFGSLQKNITDKNAENNDKCKDFCINSNFRLPIQHLDKSQIFKLDNNISNDLELNTQDNSICMHEYLFKPNNIYAKNNIKLWRKYYTTNISFLNDSKTLVSEYQIAKKNICNSDFKLDCNKLNQIWYNTKEDKYFMEKYNFLDWKIIEHLNKSDTFLQCLSVIHLCSPIISFILPFLFLIFPFFLLKIQGLPVTFQLYMDTLKTYAKNHIIGQALNSFQNTNWNSLLYLLFMVGMYCFQIYQNINLCRRFYNNVINVNNDLDYMKNYLKYTIHNMKELRKIIFELNSYSDFDKEIHNKINTLSSLLEELENIYPFEKSFNKFKHIGYMLKCYYTIHSHQDYEDALSYSVGFNGFIENLNGITENLNDGIISFANFNNKNDCKFKNQYYPPLMNETHTKNDCDLTKSIILSSPNGSGKTTYLKTVALNIIFSQQIGCGFYDNATITPYTHIHSYLNIPDTSGRDSLFQAESRRCKDIIDIIDNNSSNEYRHFCLFDELYSGTNPEEASIAGYAFLDFLQKYSNVNFILTTHYFSICKKFKKSTKIQNYKMSVEINKDGSFKFTYKIKKGISQLKGGIRVLKELNYPTQITDKFN